MSKVIFVISNLKIPELVEKWCKDNEVELKYLSPDLRNLLIENRFTFSNVDEFPYDYVMEEVEQNKENIEGVYSAIRLDKGRKLHKMLKDKNYKVLGFKYDAKDTLDGISLIPCGFTELE